MANEYELAKMKQILEENKNKPFVDRILNRKYYPTLHLGDGKYATHKMAYMQTEDNSGNPIYRVFPTVLYNGDKLKQHNPKEAFKLTSQTGDFIDFKTPEEADQFSKRYKAVWGE
jgi:hypothetical protein